MRKVIIVFVLAAVGIIGWLYWHQRRQGPFVVSGFVEADEIRAGSRVGGRVAEVFVSEGDHLKTDAPLFRIDPLDLRERLAGAKAELEARQAEYELLKSGNRPEEIEAARAKRDRAKANFDKLVAGPRPQEIAAARERANATQANLEFAQSEFTRLEKLRSRAQAAPTEYDRAVRSLKSAQAEAGAAKQELELLEIGTRKEDIAEARAALAEAEQALKLAELGYRKEQIAQAAAQVDAARANVGAIEAQIRELVIVAPCDCVVEAIDLRPGDLVGQNAPSVSLLDLSRLWVRAYVPENRLGQIRLDQRVPVRVDSFPGERFAARITFISRDAEFTPKNVQTPEERSKQVFRIKVMLEEGLDRLRVGMAADVLLDEDVGP